jgi:hypothetical protein
MPTIDTTKQQETDTTTTYAPLETDAYLMKITSAQIAPSMYENDRGEKPEEVTIVFELLEEVTHPDPNMKYKDRQYWRMKNFYGDLRSGGPSKLKAFIDGLIAEGKINSEVFIAGETDDPAVGDLIGIQRRVMIEKYTIGQGTNAGKPGNKVLAVTAPKNTGTPFAVNSKTIDSPQRFTKPAAVNLDDIEVAERKQRLEYLEGIYTSIDGDEWTQDQLAEAAADFAPLTENDQWVSKKFSARNASMLRNDIKAMWGIIERLEIARNPEKALF